MNKGRNLTAKKAELQEAKPEGENAKSLKNVQFFYFWEPN